MDVQSSLANRSKGFADPQHGKFATKLQKYALHKGVLVRPRHLL